MPNKIYVSVPDVENVYLQTPVFIDPTTFLDKTTDLKVMQHIILVSGFLKYHEQVFESLVTEFIQHREYPIIIYDKNKEKELNMILSDSLKYRMKDNLIWPCYSVYDKDADADETKIKKGAFSRVTKIKGTLNYNIYNLLIFNHKKARVAKNFDHTELCVRISLNPQEPSSTKQYIKVTPIDADNESLQCKIATHLHAKHISYKINRKEEKIASSIVMRDCPGLPLYEVFISDKKGSYKLTTFQRYQLCYMLSRMLDIQVHKKGLVHRDIKPGNIMAYINGLACEINIVDFGLAMPKLSIDDKKCGTLPYAAPEVIFNRIKMGLLTDTYSMGKVLGEVWRAITIRDAWQIRDEFKYKLSYSFPELFDGMDDLSVEEKR